MIIKKDYPIIIYLTKYVFNISKKIVKLVKL